MEYLTKQNINSATDGICTCIKRLQRKCKWCQSTSAVNHKRSSSVFLVQPPTWLPFRGRLTTTTFVVCVRISVHRIALSPPGILTLSLSYELVRVPTNRVPSREDVVQCTHWRLRVFCGGWSSETIFCRHLWVLRYETDIGEFFSIQFDGEGSVYSASTNGIGMLQFPTTPLGKDLSRRSRRRRCVQQGFAITYSTRLTT